MRLKAALEGNLKKYMRDEYRRAERAVKFAVDEATDGLKMTMRRQVLSAGLGQQPSYRRKTGELRGFRKASNRTLKTGKGLTSVVMFWLVPQVKMPKHLSFYDQARKWNNKIPDYILKHWPDN